MKYVLHKDTVLIYGKGGILFCFSFETDVFYIFRTQYRILQLQLFKGQVWCNLSGSELQ